LTDKTAGRLLCGHSTHQLYNSTAYSTINAKEGNLPDETNREPAARGEGAWIFLSHSTKDFEQVREIRNELERRGHKPLIFFLKCLERNDARLPELLRAEITARNWFILCDSPNAAASKWVQEEVAMIQGMDGKVFKKLDLSKGLQAEQYKLVELSKRATVFLSCSSADRAVAEHIRRALLKHDFSVTIPGFDGPSPYPIQEAVNRPIDAEAARGFVLVLVSPASLTSKWCKYETEYALRLAARSHRSNVVPVVVAPFARESLPPQLATLQWFDISTGRFEERMAQLIRSLKMRDME
jgi:hypothetical protein